MRPGLSIERSRDSTPCRSRNGRRRPPSPSSPFSHFEAESAHVFSSCFERLGHARAEALSFLVYIAVSTSPIESRAGAFDTRIHRSART
jgi:hypothetical protein